MQFEQIGTKITKAVSNMNSKKITFHSFYLAFDVILLYKYTIKKIKERGNEL